MRNLLLFGLVFFTLNSFAVRPTLRRVAESKTHEGKSLQEVFEAALKHSDDVKMSLEGIHQAEENYHIAIGSILPNISGTGQYQYQQNNPNTSVSGIYPNPSKQARITLTQPLFQGLKEWAGLRQTKSLVSASKADNHQAELQLYLSVAQAYFNIVSSEHDLENLDNELGFYDERIKETQKFQKIGRSQYTDVLTVESQKANLMAQKELVNTTLQAQREVLAFVTGWGANIPLERPGDLKALNNEKNLEQYLSKLEERPDFRADQARLKAAEDGIPVARAGHFPTLGLQADYYLERTGALSDVKWDGLLVLTVPLFAGGTVNSQVAEAVSKRDQAEYQVSKTKRQAIQQIQTLWQSYLGDKRQFEAYRYATELAEKTYKEQTRQYRYGLVTNLDVLTALTGFIEDQRSLDKTRYTMQFDFEQLEAVSMMSDVHSSGSKKN
jgi:outer membrane protein